MSVSDFAHTVPSHQPALVYISRYAVDASFGGVLPCEYVTSVTQHGRLVVVFRYEQLVACELSGQITIVETLVGVDDWLLAIDLFEKP